MICASQNGKGNTDIFLGAALNTGIKKSNDLRKWELNCNERLMCLVFLSPDMIIHANEVLDVSMYRGYEEYEHCSVRVIFILIQGIPYNITNRFHVQSRNNLLPKNSNLICCTQTSRTGQLLFYLDFNVYFRRVKMCISKCVNQAVLFWNSPPGSSFVTFVGSRVRTNHRN